jgi:hypothetical protein
MPFPKTFDDMTRTATPGYQGKRTDREYLACEGMLDGRDEHIRCRTTKIVVTRQPHDCFSFADGKLHPIPAGTKTIYEHAIVDDTWGSYWTCVECADAWLDQEGL